MKHRVPVTEIMSKTLVTLNLTNDLTLAETLFKQHKIRHIPVVSGKKIIGMLSYTDLLRISFADAVEDDAESVDTIVYDMFSIEQVMTRKVTVISPDTTIREAAEILAANEYHSLPVCKDDELVGIITTTDIIRYFLEQY
ncbi:MAG TPA: CBS domain-containing protein [Flavobacterium sp.]|nr:CBS domain-containing protein [Flavobacterium sp.]